MTMNWLGNYGIYLRALTKLDLLLMTWNGMLKREVLRQEETIKKFKSIVDGSSVSETILYKKNKGIPRLFGIPLYSFFHRYETEHVVQIKVCMC